MSQRDSGYERKERDLYETPEWVTRVVIPHIPMRVEQVWEPAAGGGKMVKPLKDLLEGASITATDIDTGQDFFATGGPIACDAIITNPPYELATEFIQRALDVVKPRRGVVVMLLRTDFDHAKTRQNLFGLNSPFSRKIVLTKRIKWFEDSKGQPSFNHAWFIWDWQHRGPPTLAYGPTPTVSSNNHPGEK